MKLFKHKMPFFALAIIMSTGPFLLEHHSKVKNINVNRSVANITQAATSGLPDLLEQSKVHLKNINQLIIQTKDAKETILSVKELRVLKNDKIKHLSKDIKKLKKKLTRISIDGSNDGDKEVQKETKDNIKKIVKSIKDLGPILSEKIDLIQDKVNAANQEIACQNSNALIEQKEQLEKLLAANEKLEKEKQEKLDKEKKAKEEKVAKAKEKKEKVEKVRTYFKNMYMLRSLVSGMMNNYSQTYRQETTYEVYGQTYADPMSNIFSQPSNFNWLDVLAFQNNNTLMQNPFYQEASVSNNMAINNFNIYPEYSRNEIAVDSENDLSSAEI